MDPKNESPDTTPANDTVTAPADQPVNEVNVDLTSLQTPETTAEPGNATTVAPPDGVAGGPVGTDAPAAVAPDEPTVAFMTDSNGNVQAVTTPDPSAAPVPANIGATAIDASQSAVLNDASSVSSAEPSLAAPVVDPTATVAPPPVDQLGQPQAPTTIPDAPTPADVPAPAPVPVPRNDKKMFFVLAGVAVILLAAIVAMLFV